jgi:hypothetical protein
MASIRLREAERVAFTILVDNTSDLLLADTENVKRLKPLPPSAPLAEHGLACLVSTWAGREKHASKTEESVESAWHVHR